MYAPIYQPQPYEFNQQIPVAEPPDSCVLPQQPPPQSSACSLCFKTFVYILNIMVVCIGCGCVYGSPAFKLSLHKIPQPPPYQKTIPYNLTHDMEITVNQTCDFCELQSKERDLVMWQAVLFGLFGFLNVFLIGTSVLHHCSAWNTYYTSTGKTLDPCFFVFGGIFMVFTCTALFYPVSSACSLFADTGPSIYKSDDEDMKKILKRHCYDRWRVDDAIAALVLGVFTSFMYFTATCFLAFDSANQVQEGPIVVQYEPIPPPNAYVVESNGSYGPPVYGQQPMLPQPLPPPSPQPSRSATYNVMGR